MDDGPHPEPELLTARQVAARLGVAERTVHSYVERELLRPCRVERAGMSRRLFFAPADVTAFAHQHGMAERT